MSRRSQLVSGEYGFFDFLDAPHLHVPLTGGRFRKLTFRGRGPSLCKHDARPFKNQGCDLTQTQTDSQHPFKFFSGSNWAGFAT